MVLSSDSLAELEWWIKNIEQAHRSIQHGTPDTVIFTDASNLGWGARIQNGIY